MLFLRSNAAQNNRTRGGVVVFLDGGQDTQYTDYAPIAESNNGVLNFGLFSDWHSVEAGYPDHMSWAQINDLADRGHEICSMSKTGIDMTAMSAGDRVVEFEDSLTDFYSYGLPAESINSFVYPLFLHNVDTDREAYLRYGRVFSGEKAPYIIPRSERGKALVIGRAVWAETGFCHERALQLLHRAAEEDIIICLVARTNGVSSESPTLAQFTELFELAASLGVTTMTASEAFPKYEPLFDAGFEDVDLTVWDKTLAGGTISSVTHTPDSGLPGTRSLSITGTGSGESYVEYRHPIEVSENEPVTFSARVRQAETAYRPSGVGYSYGGYLFIKEFDVYGNQIGFTQSAYVTSIVSTLWQQLTVDLTPQSTTRSIKIGFGQLNLADVTYFDHAHFGPKRFGVLG